MLIIIDPTFDLLDATGFLAEWLARDGDTVGRGQVIYRLQIEDVSVAGKAPGSGRIGLIAEAGQAVSVGEILGVIYPELDERPPDLFGERRDAAGSTASPDRAAPMRGLAGPGIDR